MGEKESARERGTERAKWKTKKRRGPRGFYKRRNLPGRELGTGLWLKAITATGESQLQGSLIEL